MTPIMVMTMTTTIQIINNVEMGISHIPSIVGFCGLIVLLAGALCWKRKVLMSYLLIIAGLLMNYGAQNTVNKIYNHDELVALVGDDLTTQIEKRTFSKYPIDKYQVVRILKSMS